MKKLIILFTLTLFVLSQAHAVDKFWRPITNDFHTALNWDPIGIPGAGDRIIFDQFGNIDCHINANINVGGWLQYNLYTVTVYIAPAVNVIIGTQDFFMDSGGLFCSDGSFDCNGHFQVVGGGYLSTTGLTTIAGDVEINPYPLGGWFTESGGLWRFDGSTNTNVIQSLVLQHIEVAKGSSKQVNCSAGIFLRATENMTLTTGFISGPGTFEVSKTCYVASGAQGGNGPLVFNDHFPGELIMDKSNLDLDYVFISKPNATDSVYLRSNSTTLNFLSSTDSLFITKGYLCVDHALTTFHQIATTIEPQGHLVASEQDLHIREDVYNNGTFHHAMGRVHFSGATNGYWDAGSGSEDFWNMTIAKSSSKDITLAPGDQFVIANRIDHQYGLVNGLTSRLSVQDTAYFGSGHQKGNILFEVISDKVSNIIMDHTTQFYTNVEINKDNNGDLVYFETNNAQLQLGAIATDNVDINTGHVAFQNVGTMVNWNSLNVNVEANGSLDAYSGTTRFSGNLFVNSGQFNHNMGEWIFDAATYSTLNVSAPIYFYDMEIEKTSSRTLTLGDNDEVHVVNLYTSDFGLLQNATADLICEKDVIFEASHQRGTVEFYFGGSGDGVFTCDNTGLTHLHMEIDKDNPGDVVYFQTNNTALTIGAIADEEVFVTQGVLAFQNCGTHVDWNFLNLHIEPAGTVEAWNGTTFFSGNFYDNGGSFDHNLGTFHFDGTTYSNIDVDNEIRFHILELAKASNRTMTVATGDVIIVEENYISDFGLLQGADAFLQIEKDALFETSHQRGSIPVLFTGSGNGVFTCDNTGLTHLHMEIAKDNPSDIVYFQTNNAALTIGAIADEEVFVTQGVLAFQNCGTHVDWNFLNLHIEPAGTLEAWSGTTFFSGNFYDNGGSFDHNLGTFHFDGTTYSNIDVDNEIRFHILELAKASNRTMTVATGDVIIVEENYISDFGLLQGADAFLHIEKDALFEASHQRGTIPVIFAGSGNGVFTCDNTGLTHLHMEIAKDNPSDIVYFQTNNTALTIGAIADEEVFVTQGTIAFQNCGTHVDWNFLNLHIEPAGTVEAWSGTTFFSGNFYDNGGTFDHNLGTFHFDAVNYTNIDVDNEIRFHILELDKGSSRSMTVATGDAIIVEENYISDFGLLQGADAFLRIEKNAHFEASHQRGTIPLFFVGPTAGVCTLDQTFFWHSTVEVNKDPGASLVLATNNANLVIGASDDTFTLSEGDLSFSGAIGLVDWNILNTSINGGSWTCHSGETRWSWHFDYTGGDFNHNMGQFNFDATNYVNANTPATPHFWDLSIKKGSSRTITLGASDEFVVENLMTFDFGGAYQGTINAKSDVVVTNTWNGGNTKLLFSGIGDQDFDLTGGQTLYNGVIEIDKPSGDVVLQSNLYIDVNFAQLSLISGNLGSAIPGTHKVRFAAGVDTGWSGGNNDSYISAPLEKIGVGDITLPTGDNGVFAPCGITLNSNNGLYLIEYHNNSPAIDGYGNSFGPGIDHVSACEYWTMDLIAGVGSARAVLSYDTNRCGPINDPSTLRVAGWDVGIWNDEGNVFDDGYYITGNTTTTWGPKTLASSTPDNPMDTSGAPCLADYNADGTRNTADLLILLGEFGCVSGCATDLDGNDMTNTADLLILLSVFGIDCP